MLTYIFLYAYKRFARGLSGRPGDAENKSWEYYNSPPPTMLVRSNLCRIVGRRNLRYDAAETSFRYLSSVSISETEKFNALHAEWWDPNKNPLIHMNPVRVEYILKQISSNRNNGLLSNEGLSSSPQQDQSQSQFSSSCGGSLCFSGLKMLDIGCGGGLLSESLVRLGADEVTGIDPSEHLLEVARQRAERLFSETSLSRPAYESTTAEEWSQQRPCYYDVICIMDVVEHIQDLDSLLRATAMLVKPGGFMILSTLNRTAISYMLTIVGAEYVMGYIPVGTHDWNNYRSPTEMQDVLAPLSFVPVDVCGMVLRKPPLLGWHWSLDPHNTDINWVGTYKLPVA